MVADMTAGNTDIELVGTMQQRIDSCLNVLDQLLTAPQAVVSSIVVADKKNAAPASQLTLIDHVLQIMGLRDIKAVPKSTSLGDVGMDSLMVVEIKQLMERIHDVFFTTQQLHSLTIGELEEMSTAGGDNRRANVPARDQRTNVLIKVVGIEAEHNRRLLSINAVEKGPVIVCVPGERGATNAPRRICKFFQSVSLLSQSKTVDKRPLKMSIFFPRH